ncbi:MAG: hypothetical protein M1827_007141 [Pycnora praestabilis]|nr:MAG: hypothetical protein M1827_007141 [Pycnora praestabilis]
MATTMNPHYRALVDMGSNGIRFSISNLEPLTARIMPTIYQDRAGISLYDAQYNTAEKAAIPQNIIDDVIVSLCRFKRTCQDFGVPEGQVRILATEATREAINSVEFRQTIEDNTGWVVEMLPKEDEGRVGAMGVASSFTSVKGLVMDLGGGSTQLTWMIVEGGEVKTSPRGAVSLPYGAAAMTRRLAEADNEGKRGREHLKAEMRENIKRAYQELDVPHELETAAKEIGGYSLYLSGGGYRGWGYILMSQHRVKPYPIPIINGFRVGREAFQDTINIQEVAEEDDVFRVSERRASQVPAVAFLVNVLTDVLPQIKEARFCQGGVREGTLYSSLPQSIRALPPLSTATLSHAPYSSQFLLSLLRGALPNTDVPPSLTTDLLTAAINLLYHHSSLPKETRAAAALHCTTTGLLTGVHGVSHEDRALLALLLCERWGGSVSPTDADFLLRLQALVGDQLSWWAKYLGRFAGVLGDVYPAGLVRDAESEEKPKIRARWQNIVTKKGKDDFGISIAVDVIYSNDSPYSGEILAGSLEVMEKVGKEKNWIGGKEGWGRRVEVDVSLIHVNDY